MNKVLAWLSFVVSLIALGVALTALALGMKDVAPVATSNQQNVVEQNAAIQTAPAESSAPESVATADYCDAALGFGFDYPAALGEPDVTDNDLVDSSLSWGTNPDDLLPSNATGASTFSLSVNNQGGIGLEPFEDVDRHEISTDVVSGNWALLEWGGDFGEVPELNFLLMVNFSDGTNDYQIMALYDERPTEAQEDMVVALLESWTNTCVE